MRQFHFKSLFVFVLLGSILLSTFAPALAQLALTLAIDTVRDENYPLVDTYVSVMDAQGYPVTGLLTEHFSITEDGQPVSAFQLSSLSDAPLSLVFVIDVRASMGYGGNPSHLERLIQSINAFVDTLAPQDSVGVVKISNPSAVVLELTTDKAAVQDAVSKLVPEQYANVNDAIVTAVDMVRSLSGRRAVVLISGGADAQISQRTFEQALDDAVRQKVVFYPITWGAAPKEQMQNLADLTHGEAQFLGVNPPDQNALDAAFVPLGKSFVELRSQYKLSFSAKTQADDKEHTLVVKVDYLGGHAEQSGFFNARAGEVIVSLPELTDGQTVSGQVRFAPAVTAPSNLSDVQITLDGQFLTSISVAPFEFQWDSTTASPGEHIFIITAADELGNSGQTAITLQVEPPITIAITSPAEGSTVSDKITVAADVTSLAKVDRVEFTIDAVLYNTDSSTPYEFEWNPVGVGDEAHKITARAVDVNGYSAETTVNFTVAVVQSKDGESGIGAWLAVLVVLAFVGILIPFGLRSRRKMAATVDNMPTELPGGPLAGGGFSGAVLRELEGLSPNQVWSLTKEETYLGRKRDENDIPIKGMQASRQHAMIRLYGNQHIIHSLKAENPVFVNDQPVMQPRPLQKGDRIRIGETLLRYEAF